MAIAQYKCPNCGKILAFRADKQGWFCENCESLFKDEEIKIRFDFNENSKYKFPEKKLDKADIEFSEKARSYICKKCGSEFISDSSQPVEKCIFCHGKTESPERVSGEFRPYSTIEFSVSEEQAKSAFRNWCAKKKFLPSGYEKKADIRKIYIPFQIADCVIKASAGATGKKIRTEKDKQFKYIKTKEFGITRDAIITFDGVPADNTGGLSKETIDSIEPFDFRKAVPFDIKHISQTPANFPDSNKKIPFANVKNRCVFMSDNMLRQSMKGYSSLSVEKVDVNIMDTRWRYILIPVWLYTYHYNGKIYEFAVNGQNGRAGGNPPLSIGKLLAVCIGAGLLTTALFILGGIYLI